MTSIPSSGAAGKATPSETRPVFEIVNRADRKQQPSGNQQPPEGLSFEARVEEVRQNGGLLWRRRIERGAKKRLEVYEYQRLSRDGGPLTGAESRRPPVYTLEAWGTLAVSCSCPQAKRTGAICKHQTALTRELTEHRRITGDLTGGSNE